ncbi:hypothetical protein B0J13DRAFT_649921 [Dactylonectria estremocensis]|uniref:Transcription activator GCR1-like domain-containing protein n=1 Tax=Dactylonectria estremocensis TaxID=1079267 RepID=A0A9P9FCN3_9HYPO|nr:hypothetical protein B0J13DRAFT_649921 [Dactylonectria estremocensis]
MSPATPDVGQARRTESYDNIFVDMSCNTSQTNTELQARCDELEEMIATMRERMNQQDVQIACFSDFINQIKSQSAHGHRSASHEERQQHSRIEAGETLLALNKSVFIEESFAVSSQPALPEDHDEIIPETPREGYRNVEIPDRQLVDKDDFCIDQDVIETTQFGEDSFAVMSFASQPDKHAPSEYTLDSRNEHGKRPYIESSPDTYAAAPRSTRQRASKRQAVLSANNPSLSQAVSDLSLRPSSSGSNPHPSRSSTTKTSTTVVNALTTNPSTTKDRYSRPRSTGLHYAAGPPGGGRYLFRQRLKSVTIIWKEWNDGLDGDPSLESLERDYGTAWRRGSSLQELKYGGNYVGKRLKIVNQIRQMCEEQDISPEKACRVLDAVVDGRMELLIKVLRRNGDPMSEIPPK